MRQITLYGNSYGYEDYCLFSFIINGKAYRPNEWDYEKYQEVIEAPVGSVIYFSVTNLTGFDCPVSIADCDDNMVADVTLAPGATLNNSILAIETGTPLDELEETVLYVGFDKDIYAFPSLNEDGSIFISMKI